jgi:hypothetical protein
MAYNTTNVSKPEPQRIGDIHAAHGELENAANNLEKALEDLAARLVPVLGGGGSTDGLGTACPMYSSPLANSIQAQELRIRSLTDGVRDILARLEV